MKKIEDKEKFLYENLNYILAPYYLYKEKTGVISLNNKKIRKLPKDLIIILSNYLTGDNETELEKYVLNIKHDKDYLKKYKDIIYLSLEKQNNKFKYDDMIILLDNVKKYLNKDSLNNDKLILLKGYYDLENNKKN